MEVPGKLRVLILGADCDDFDRTIIQIADEAGNEQGCRFAMNKIAESDTLDRATDNVTAGNHSALSI